MGGEKVWLSRCGGYAPEELLRQMEEAFTALGVWEEIRPGMKVVLKPNLVMSSKPEAAIATHPALVAAVGKCVQKAGGGVLTAESPGGPYTPAALGFVSLISDPGVNVLYMAIVVFVGFFVLSFNLQGGLERVTKYMMVALLLLMVVLAVRSVTLPGAAEGLTFYLMPDLTKITGSTVVAAMNQAFFTLSLGIGSMAIFGSYIGKEHTLMGESIHIIALDSFVAITAGLILFPACFTYNLEVGSGPSLLFDTMAAVFNNMEGGRWWGAMFFLFMVFAAMSTVFAVFENILACVREMTGWSRPKGSVVCGVVIFLLSLTTALGYSVFSGFVPFAAGSAWLDLWDFLVSYNLLPLGSLCMVLFCCNRWGWGWDNFLSEANSGKGPKFRSWLKPFCQYVLPLLIIFIYLYGMITFPWR